MDAQTSVGDMNAHKILQEPTSTGCVATEQRHKQVEGISMEKWAKVRAYEAWPSMITLKPKPLQILNNFFPLQNVNKLEIYQTTFMPY
jgi:hypothetical protein